MRLLFHITAIWCCFLSAAPASAAPGHVDRSFNASLRTNESVFSLGAQNVQYSLWVESLCVLPDGDILAGHSFGVMRLHSDGTRDTNFVCRTDGVVSTLALQPGGDILIGGSFKKVNGVPRASLARIFASQHASQPFLFGPFVVTGGFELRIPTMAQYAYYLESKDAVDDKEWKLLLSLPGDGSYMTVSDPAHGAGKRFYRVSVKRDLLAGGLD